MRTTSAAVAIAFDDQGGRGEPALLCLPGWCSNRSVFDGLVKACGRKRRTLSMDLRGHGESAASPQDFGEAELIEDALALIQESGVRQIVPVALSHAGWIAIELRRRLGADRVPAIVLLDWLVLDPPPPFIGALGALQDPNTWQATRDQLFGMWLHGVEHPDVIRSVREDMGAYGADMWARAGREISAGYRREGNPLKALSELTPHVRTLHLYAQPADPGFLQAQQAFAASNPWFSVHKLNATSHFPMLEIPDDMAKTIESFVAQS